MNSKENLLRAIRRTGPAWVPDGMESVISVMPPVVERPAQAGLDAFGVRWDLNERAEGGTFPAHGGHTIAHLPHWRDQISIPNLNALDWTLVQQETESIDRETHLVSGFVEMGLFERAYLLLGMENALVAFLTQPDEMRQLLTALADYKIALIRQFDDVADLDMIWFGDDWGTQANLFLPPDTWRSLIKPELGRIYRAMQERGILINQHSCGKIDAIIGDLVELGVDVWNPCQPCNDLARLKLLYGDKMAFCGGLDSQFVLGRPGVTAQDVRKEVRLRIDMLASGGGYIAAPSHSVPYDPAIVAAMHDEIARYGRHTYGQKTRSA